MKNNEELGGNKGWAKQGVFPADGDGQIRRSASCAQLKAEQGLALTQDRQRSCLMSRPPTAPMPPTRGKIEADLSWVLQMGHPSTHSSDTGAALCHSMRETSSGVWEPAASSCSHKAPGNSMPRRGERAAGLLPRRSGCRARTRPVLANRPFHGGATISNKSCPCRPPALPAALPAWHRAKPLNKGGLGAERTLTPRWISLDRPRRGASPTPPRLAARGTRPSGQLQ